MKAKSTIKKLKNKKSENDLPFFNLFSYFFHYTKKTCKNPEESRGKYG